MVESATLLDSYTEMTEILLPNDTNDLGRALGGVVLHWMDLCGAIAAMRFSNRHCVTAAMDNVDFVGPIDLGEIALIEGFVFDVGSSSLEVRVEVRAEDPRTGDERTTTTSFFTFVALDDDGGAARVPRLSCPTENQRELQAEARRERARRIRQIVDRLEE